MLCFLFGQLCIVTRKLSYQTQNQINKSYSFNILGWHITRIIWSGIAQHSKWYNKQKACRYRLSWTVWYKVNGSSYHHDACRQRTLRESSYQHMMNSSRNTSLGPTGISWNARLPTPQWRREHMGRVLINGFICVTTAIPTIPDITWLLLCSEIFPRG